LEAEDKIIKIEKNIWNTFSKQNNIGLYTGLSGFILFYDSMHEVYKKGEFEDKLLQVIEKANELIENSQNLVSLSSGIAGYGITLLRLKNKNVEIDEVYFESIDAALIEDFQLFCKSNDFDFMHQAMGIAMYFIERYKTTKNTTVTEILDTFSKNLISEININFKNVLIQTDDNRGDYYSLGLAHGIAGYLNFLIYLKKHFTALDVDICEPLRVCVDFLVSYKRYDHNSKQHYPNVISLQTNSFLPSRLSWCQGDLGISNALYNTGVFLDDATLTNEAIKLMNHSATINFKDSGVNDFGICHGSAGILIQFFLASKKYNQDYSQEIDYWFEELKKQTNNFEEYNWFDNETNTYRSKVNLDLGSIGLGLTLLTIENKINTKWLEIFNLH
jgi:lantibiotic biosynthesis protein